MRRPGQIASLGLALLAIGCGSGDRPEIGDAYYDLVAQLGVAGVEINASETLPVAKPEEELLFLPAGASVEYLLFAEPDSTFRAEGVVVRGEGTRLE